MASNGGRAPVAAVGRPRRPTAAGHWWQRRGAILPQPHRAAERSIAWLDDLEIPFEAARSRLVLGQVQRRAKKKRVARESLERARDSFSELGARLWADRARSRTRAGRWPAAHTVRTDRHRTADRRARRPGAHESGDRRRPVRESQHRRGQPEAHLPKARCPFPNRTRREAWPHAGSLTQPRVIKRTRRGGSSSHLRRYRPAWSQQTATLQRTAPHRADSAVCCWSARPSSAGVAPPLAAGCDMGRFGSQRVVFLGCLMLAVTLVLVGGAERAAAAACDAATKTWDGGAGTDSWTAPANWSPDGLPTPADDVCIAGASVTVPTSAAARTFQIASGAGVTISSGAQLAVAGPAGSSVDSGATLAVAGTLVGGEHADRRRVPRPQRHVDDQRCRSSTRRRARSPRRRRGPRSSRGQSPTTGPSRSRRARSASRARGTRRAARSRSTRAPC